MAFAGGRQGDHTGAGGGNGMEWHRLRRLLVIALSVFGVIALAGGVLIAVWVPTLSTYRLVAFMSCMFAVTGAAVTVAVAAIGGYGRK